MTKEELKIAVFSSLDRSGGAAMACYNCVKILRDQGYNAIEVVRYKYGNDEFVYPVNIHRKQSYFRRVINKLFPPKVYRDVKEDTDPEYRFFGDDSDSPDMCTIEEIENSIPFIPNVIFVGHTFNLVNTEILAQMHEKWGCYIYLSCNDISPYTGGCHVHWDCKGYTSGCKNCPAVLVESRKHEVAEAFEKKRKNIEKGKIGLRYSNNWLKKEIEQSLMFRGNHIFCTGQNTDTDLYNPGNRNIAKQVFGISNGSITIMNGSTSLNDTRKGLVYFCEAMQRLYDMLSEDIREKVTLLIIGRNKESVQHLLNKLPEFDVKNIDYITDSRLMSLAYQATDIYVGTSLEDAGPMMVSDSLACGTPVVGFKTGFFDDEEIVIDGVSGYGVEMKDVNMLAERIKDIICLSVEEYRVISENCRKIAINKLSKYRTLELYNDFFSKL